MKRKITIPTITYSYKLVVNDPSMKEQSFEQEQVDIKDLQRFIGLMSYTQLNGRFELVMWCDNEKLFSTHYQVKDGKLEGVELWIKKQRDIIVF